MQPNTSKLIPEFDVKFRWLFKIAFFILSMVFVAKIFPILLIILMGIFLAISLEPATQKISSLVKSRRVSIILVALTISAVVGVTAIYIIPNVFDQMSLIVSEFPKIKQTLLAQIKPGSPLQDMVNQLLNNPNLISTTDLMSNGGKALLFLLEGVTKFGLVLIFSIYFLVDGKRAFKWISDFFSAPVRLKLQKTGREASAVIHSYVTGQMVISLTCATYSYVVLSYHHIPAAFSLAILAGALDVIPVIGFIMALVPAVLLSLLVSTETAFAILMLYLVYHFIEVYILIPRIYGNKLKVSSLVVMIALLVAGSTGGIAAALVILPIVATYPIIERIWLVRMLGNPVVNKHSENTDVLTFSDQVKLWDKNITAQEKNLHGRLQNNLKGVGKNILIVDDDDDIRTLLGDILQNQGYSCSLAANGNEALVKLNEDPEFGLILLDQMMPFMDGPSFLKEIKRDSRFADIPVVFLSASTDSLETGSADGVLQKPSEMHAVLSIVDRLYKEPGHAVDEQNLHQFI